MWTLGRIFILMRFVRTPPLRPRLQRARALGLRVCLYLSVSQSVHACLAAGAGGLPLAEGREAVVPDADARHLGRAARPPPHLSVHGSPAAQSGSLLLCSSSSSAGGRGQRRRSHSPLSLFFSPPSLSPLSLSLSFSLSFSLRSRDGRIHRIAHRIADLIYRQRCCLRSSS